MLCKTLVVFYSVNFYICVLMTCSTSYCLCDTEMDARNVCIYLYMYVRIYVCVYVYMYTCMHAWPIMILS